MDVVAGPTGSSRAAGQNLQTVCQPRVIRYLLMILQEEVARSCIRRTRSVLPSRFWDTSRHSGSAVLEEDFRN